MIVRILFGMICPGAMRLYTGAEEGAAVAALSEGAGAGAAAAGTGEAVSGIGITAAESAALAGGGTTLGSLAAQYGPQLAVSAAGQGLKYIAGNDALERKKAIAKSLKDYQMTQAAKSRGQSEGFVDTLDPTQRASDLVAAQTGLNSDYTKSVGESMAFDPSGPISGKISQQYKTDSAGQADAASARLKKIIENLSVMRAPGQVAQTVGRRYGLAAGGVGGVNSNIASAGGAGSTDIEGVQPNPWLTGAGDALTGASQGIAARKTLKNSGGVF